jgi:hypothetical protein
MAELPMQTPNQGVFGDSVAIVADGQRDGSKNLAATAEVVPGLPASLIGTGADQGKLGSAGGASSVSYGAFIQLPINTISGRTSLGEMEAKKATTLLNGRIRVRNAVYQDTNGVQTTIPPFNGTAPVSTNVGTLVNAIEVAAGPSADNPFTTVLLKWTMATGAGNGYLALGVITWVSDDGTEVEIRIFDKYTLRTGL